MELKAFEYKDSIVLVDDFHPTTSTTEKREMERLISEILRRYGDNISKSRATKYLTRQKEFEPIGLVVRRRTIKVSGHVNDRFLVIDIKKMNLILNDSLI